VSSIPLSSSSSPFPSSSLAPFACWTPSIHLYIYHMIFLLVWPYLFITVFLPRLWLFPISYEGFNLTELLPHHQEFFRFLWYYPIVLVCVPVGNVENEDEWTFLIACMQVWVQSLDCDSCALIMHMVFSMGLRQQTPWR
jgi:hypothetical protein